MEDYLGPREYFAESKILHRPPLNSSELFYVLKEISEQLEHKTLDDMLFIRFRFIDTKKVYRLFLYKDGKIELARQIGSRDHTGDDLTKVMGYVKEQIYQAAAKSAIKRERATGDIGQWLRTPEFSEAASKYGVREAKDYRFLNKPIHPLGKTAEKHKSNGQKVHQLCLDDDKFLA